MHNQDLKIASGGGSIQSLFHNTISLANLLQAWKKFKEGKTNKEDVVEFEFNLENNLFSLHRELVNKTYIPEPYQAFFVCDPKRRYIHKATVRDRVLHQAVFQILYPIFNQHFIFDSYSSQIDKGTHKGSKRLFVLLRKESQNWRCSVFALKCDIMKFFDSIDHEILFELIKRKITDTDTLWLVEKIINSFSKTTVAHMRHGVYVPLGKSGLPLGNVTSQLFSNIYLNELDQFIKHKLKAKSYLRYTDDFILISKNKDMLLQNVFEIQKFLKQNLKLDLHPNKIHIKKLKQGIDFVGYVVLSNSVVLRTRTKNRILRKIEILNKNLKEGKIKKEKLDQSLSSYFGVLKHCKSNKIKREIKKML